VRRIIIKIGGSVLTDKNREQLIVRQNVIKRLAKEIKKVKEIGYEVVLIHGAGSAGHPIVKRYNLRGGLFKEEQRRGVVEVQEKLNELSSKILMGFLEEDLPLFRVTTSSIVILRHGRIKKIFIDPIKQALEYGFIPLLSGDLAFDEIRKIAVCSGDQLAFEIAKMLNVKLVIFGVDVDGIYPTSSLEGEPLKEVSFKGLSKLVSKLGGSKGIDVTGGMRGKILEALLHPWYFERGGEVWILNMLKEGMLIRALKGEGTFTRIRP